MKTSAMVTTKPALLPPRLRGEAERNADQHQNQAGCRVGEPLVQFDQIGFAARSFGVLIEHVVVHRENGRVGVADVRVFLGADGQGKFRFRRT